MVKYVAFAKIRLGADPDEAYTVWRDKHGPWCTDKFLPEAKRYTISRVLRTVEGEEFFGIAEVWFDSIESAERAMQRVLSAPPDEFMSKWMMDYKRMFVEEADVELT